MAVLVRFGTLALDSLRRRGAHREDRSYRQRSGLVLPRCFLLLGGAAVVTASDVCIDIGFAATRFGTLVGVAEAFAED